MSIYYMQTYSPYLSAIINIKNLAVVVFITRKRKTDSEGRADETIIIIIIRATMNLG